MNDTCSVTNPVTVASGNRLLRIVATPQRDVGSTLRSAHPGDQLGAIFFFFFCPDWAGAPELPPLGFLPLAAAVLARLES